MIQENILYPVLCTRGMQVFPNNEIIVEVGRESSIRATTLATDLNNNLIVVVSQIDPMIDSPEVSDLFTVGTVAEIQSVVKNKDNSLKVTIKGIKRARLRDLTLQEGYFTTHVDILEDIHGDEAVEVALVRQVIKSIDEFSSLLPNLPKDLVANFSKGILANELADGLCQHFPMHVDRRQELLEALEINERLKLLIVEISDEQQIAMIEQMISQKVQERINENQKEFYLREKLKVIKEELGDVTNRDDDVQDMRDLINSNPYPDHVKEKALEELMRFEMMHTGASEANVVRSYLDWLLKTPWYQKSTDQDDLHIVEDILNEDHFGLDKIKERILEYIAVKKMTDSLKAPILCLTGPPGVGKTSLAKSIARSLNREFVKISLGGVKDESEIRGHRRTYLGSMPGRIIQGMKKAGVINPVFLLDEIDKMASDYKGDPASAMLEVLDPQQNQFFSDHYLEENYDLSNVLFIATANYLENIPPALKDRLEVIQLSSYTEQEKLAIAKQHLVRKQIQENGLKASQMKINDEALMLMIQHYTRESGVRQLERVIAKVCRKVVTNILKEKYKSVTITKNNLDEYLGKKIFEHNLKEKESEVGLVTGLAYTQFGGDILPIEVTYFSGKGQLIITGQLGDVMKESARIALDLVKSQANKYNIAEDFFTKNDIHLHVPEGAVPKDGPSAGIAMTTAFLSAFTNQKVSAVTGMTGEVTLRGHVLPIGGLKEKSIAAHRSGLKNIIIPKGNEKDVEDIPDIVREQLNIVLVDNIENVFEEIFKL